MENEQKIIREVDSEGDKLINWLQKESILWNNDCDWLQRQNLHACSAYALSLSLSLELE